jgi:hypothetical protein
VQDRLFRDASVSIPGRPQDDGGTRGERIRGRVLVGGAAAAPPNGAALWLLPTIALWDQGE